MCARVELKGKMGVERTTHTHTHTHTHRESTDMAPLKPYGALLMQYTSAKYKACKRVFTRNKQKKNNPI